MNPAAANLKRHPILIFGIFCLMGFSIQATAQTYSNPSYRAAPRKGEAVTTPNYSNSQPSYSPSTPASNSGNNSREAGGSGSELGFNVALPVAVGVAGQGLTSKFGFSGQLYLAPMLDDSLKNYLTVGYDSFRLRADSVATLHIIPFGLGFEFQPVPGKTFQPNLGVAFGGAYAMIAVPESFTFNGRAYFWTQVRPGLDINLDDFALVINTPINWVIGTTNMSYINYSFGARFSL